MSWAPAESEPGGGRSDAAPIGLLAGASEASVWDESTAGSGASSDAFRACAAQPSRSAYKAPYA